MKNIIKIFYRCLFFVLWTISSLMAERFIVTNTNSSGAGSLLQAVNDANNLAGQDTILFAANVRGTINNYGTIVLTDGLVMIGPGPDLLAISANQNGRVVYIDYCYGKNFHFEGLTFKDGRTTNFAGAGLCGVSDTTRLINCIVKNNESVCPYSGGGGVALWPTYLYIENCLIFDNKSKCGSAGLGVGSGSLVIVKNTSVCNNTITGNAFSGGGGISSSGNLYMENCTISGNTHPICGGAIYVYNSNLNLNNCTITNNFAGNCGGIYEGSVVSDDTAIVISNCIVAGNTSDSSSKDLYGRIYSRGYNLIQVQTGATILGDVTGNIYGQDPLLGTLQSYSSTVMFYPLLTGSPAIESGNDLSCTLTDQRGICRPQDGDDDGNSAADIGAIEMMVDNDADGISDEEEKGPNGNDPTYDGNNDGIPDCTQSNASSFWNFNDEYYLTLAVPTGYKLINVRAIDNPSPLNAPNVEFPVGFFSFIIDLQGNTGPVVITMYLPQGVVITDYYKYGQTPVLPLPHWYQFMYDLQTGVEIIQPNIINLHFIDGQRGDNDITVNNFIVEPGGPVGSASDVEDEATLLMEFKLYQNYPNPFNPTTVISYQLPVGGDVTIKVYDLLGREVATLVDEYKPAGNYEVEFNPSSGSSFRLVRNLSSGIYFCRLQTENYSKTIKMLYLK